jgi:hypothetical protein
MKKYALFSLIAAGGLFLTACSKEEPKAGGEVTKGSTPVSPGAADTAKAAASDVKKAAEGQAADATQAAKDTAAAATSQAQGLIDKAKAYIADKKYEDALALVKQLGSLKLTPDQQKLVDDLKAEVQKAMAGQAAKDAGAAVGDVLGGKK